MTTAADGPLPPAALGLAAPAAAGRVQADLARAEQRFVAEVVRAGGIGPWRDGVDDRLDAARLAAGTRRPSRSATAGLVIALADRPTRDRCWQRVELDGPRDWLPLWRHLVRHALPPYRAEALFLLAWSCWRADDPLAGPATEILLAEDPSHRAGALLDVLLRAEVPSSAVIPLIAARRAPR